MGTLVICSCDVSAASSDSIGEFGPSSAEADLGEASNNGNLADRIRALQTHASRLAQSDGPKTRN